MYSVSSKNFWTESKWPKTNWFDSLKNWLWQRPHCGLTVGGFCCYLLVNNLKTLLFNLQQPHCSASNWQSTASKSRHRGLDFRGNTEQENVNLVRTNMSHALSWFLLFIRFLEVYRNGKWLVISKVQQQQLQLQRCVQKHIFQYYIHVFVRRLLHCTMALDPKKVLTGPYTLQPLKQLDTSKCTKQ